MCSVVVHAWVEIEKNFVLDKRGSKKSVTFVVLQQRKGGMCVHDPDFIILLRVTAKPYNFSNTCTPILHDLLACELGLCENFCRENLSLILPLHHRYQLLQPEKTKQNTQVKMMEHIRTRKAHGKTTRVKLQVASSFALMQKSIQPAKKERRCQSCFSSKNFPDSI